MVPNFESKVQKSLRVGAAKAAHRFTSDYSIQDAKRLLAVVVEIGQLQPGRWTFPPKASQSQSEKVIVYYVCVFNKDSTRTIAVLTTGSREIDLIKF